MPGPSRPLPPRESAQVRAEQVLGPHTATRLATFGDGVLYVKAGRWARFLAWLVDFVVFVFVLGVGVVVVAVVDLTADLDDGTILVSLIAVLFLMPLLVIGAIVGVLGGGGNVADSRVWVSVDARATRQLRDAGIT